MPHDPTDDIFAELERRHGRQPQPTYAEPDPGLGAADPEALADLKANGDARREAEWRHNRDLAWRAYRVMR